MRSTLALSVVAATAIAVSAQDCNPSYNVAGSTECYTNCNVKAGSAIIGTWTMDHTSPDFIPSLALMCEKTGPNYSTFMTNAGMCMIACAGDDPELFNAEFAGACAWYASHKNDKCASDATTTTTTKAVVTTTTAAATTTTTAAPVTTTTVAAVVTTTTDAAAVTTATDAAATTTVAVVDTNAVVTNTSAVATAIATSVVNASAPLNSSAVLATSSFVHSFTSSVSSSAEATQSPNSANKVKLSGYALALAAGVAFYAF